MIMDRYEEALSRARHWLENGETLETTKKCLEIIFPELRESEDEKIRKEIIGYLNSKVATAEETELLYFKRWITHLEKLKEQEPVNFYFPKGVNMNTPKSKIAVIIGQYAARTGMNKDEYHSLLETLNTQSKQKLSKKDKKIVRALQYALNCADAQNAITKSGIEVSEVATFLQDLVSSYERAEKQKEQHPAEHLELKAGKWYICHRAYCCRADHLTVKEGERFMCEEDGVVKGFVIKEPEKYFIECSAPALMEDEQKEQKPSIEICPHTKSKSFVEPYMKGRNDAMASVKPAEWSEEDKRKLEQAIYVLHQNGYEDVENFLKSLRPQPKQEKDSYKDGFVTARRTVARVFMQYLDENRPEGKMCLSNGECEDIERAFIAGDWDKIIRYANKYQPHWKPSEEQMDALDYARLRLEIKGDETMKALESLFKDLQQL